MFTTTLETVAPPKLTVPKFSIESVTELDVLLMYVLSPSFGLSFTQSHSLASLVHPVVPETTQDTVSPFAFGRSAAVAGAVLLSRYMQ